MSARERMLDAAVDVGLERHDRARVVSALRTCLDRLQGDESALEAAYRAAAQRKSRDGEIEVDGSAVVSESEGGAYVAAWLWVDVQELDEPA